MLYDIAFLGPWLIAAAAYGLLVGAFALTPDSTLVQAPGGRSAFAAFAIALLVEFAHVLPGRWNYWLETAILLFAAYAVGCLLGQLARSLFAGGARSA